MNCHEQEDLIFGSYCLYCDGPTGVLASYCSETCRESDSSTSTTASDWEPNSLNSSRNPSDQFFYRTGSNGRMLSRTASRDSSLSKPYSPFTPLSPFGSMSQRFSNGKSQESSNQQPHSQSSTKDHFKFGLTKVPSLLRAYPERNQDELEVEFNSRFSKLHQFHQQQSLSPPATSTVIQNRKQRNELLETRSKTPTIQSSPAPKPQPNYASSKSRFPDQISTNSLRRKSPLHFKKSTSSIDHEERSSGSTVGGIGRAKKTPSTISGFRSSIVSSLVENSEGVTSFGRRVNGKRTFQIGSNSDAEDEDEECEEDDDSYYGRISPSTTTATTTTRTNQSTSSSSSYSRTYNRNRTTAPSPRPNLPTSQAANSDWRTVGFLPIARISEKKTRTSDPKNQLKMSRIDQDQFELDYEVVVSGPGYGHDEEEEWEEGFSFEN